MNKFFSNCLSKKNFIVFQRTKQNSNISFFFFGRLPFREMGRPENFETENYLWSAADGIPKQCLTKKKERKKKKKDSLREKKFERRGRRKRPSLFIFLWAERSSL